MVPVQSECTENRGAIGSLATLLALATVTLAGCTAALITVLIHNKKLRNKHTPKKGSHPPWQQAPPTPVEPPPLTKQGTIRTGYNKSLVPNVVYANYAECDKEAASIRGSSHQLDVIQDEYDYIDPEEDM